MKIRALHDKLVDGDTDLTLTEYVSFFSAISFFQKPEGDDWNAEGIVNDNLVVCFFVSGLDIFMELLINRVV